MKTVALDFDGVIHNYKEPKPGRKMGPPIPGTKDALELLKSAGYTIIIHSCNRAQAIKDFMSYYQLPYDSIWEGQGKPVADAYLDDKAIKFVHWDQVLSALL